MMSTFTFTLNRETKELVFAGNIKIEEAYQILFSILLSETARKAKEGEGEKVSTPEL